MTKKRKAITNSWHSNSRRTARASTTASILPNNKTLARLRKDELTSRLPQYLRNRIMRGIGDRAVSMGDKEDTHSVLVWRDLQGPRMYLGLHANDTQRLQAELAGDIEKIRKNRKPQLFLESESFPQTLIVDLGSANASVVERLVRDAFKKNSPQPSRSALHLIQRQSADGQGATLEFTLTRSYSELAEALAKASKKRQTDAHYNVIQAFLARAASNEGRNPAHPKDKAAQIARQQELIRDILSELDNASSQSANRIKRQARNQALAILGRELHKKNAVLQQEAALLKDAKPVVPPDPGALTDSTPPPLDTLTPPSAEVIEQFHQRQQNQSDSEQDRNSDTAVLPTRAQPADQPQNSPPSGQQNQSDSEQDRNSDTKDVTEKKLRDFNPKHIFFDRKYFNTNGFFIYAGPGAGSIKKGAGWKLHISLPYDGSGTDDHSKTYKALAGILNRLRHKDQVVPHKFALPDKYEKLIGAKLILESDANSTEKHYQQGKFITIYPKDLEELKKVSTALKELMEGDPETYGFSNNNNKTLNDHVPVLNENQPYPGFPIYARYGIHSGKSDEIELENTGQFTDPGDGTVPNGVLRAALGDDFGNKNKYPVSFSTKTGNGDPITHKRSKYFKKSSNGNWTVDDNYLRYFRSAPAQRDYELAVTLFSSRVMSVADFKNATSGIVSKEYNDTVTALENYHAEIDRTQQYASERKAELVEATKVKNALLKDRSTLEQKKNRFQKGILDSQQILIQTILERNKLNPDNEQDQAEIARLDKKINNIKQTTENDKAKVKKLKAEILAIDDKILRQDLFFINPQLEAYANLFHYQQQRLNDRAKELANATKTYRQKKPSSGKQKKKDALDTMLDQVADSQQNLLRIKQAFSRAFGAEYDHQLSAPMELLPSGTASEVYKVTLNAPIADTGTNTGFAKKAPETENDTTINLGFSLPPDTSFSEIADPEQRPNLIARQVLSYRVATQLGVSVVSPELFSRAHDGSVLGVSGIARGREMMKGTDGGDVYPHFDLNNPATQKGLSDLQIMDAITGQMDRHMGNIFVDPTTGKVTGIDNDMAYPKVDVVDKRSVNALKEQFSGDGVKEPLVYHQSLIARDTAERIIAMDRETLRTTLQGNPHDPERLDSQAIENTLKRFDAVKAQCLKLQQEGKLIEADGWNEDTMHAAIENGFVVNGNDSKDHTNYLARAVYKYAEAGEPNNPNIQLPAGYGNEPPVDIEDSPPVPPPPAIF